MIPTSAGAQISFGAPTTLPTSSDVSGLAVVDLNNDGWRDLAVCEEYETLSLYLNRHDGQFDVATTIYQPSALLSLLHATDLDGNGFTDAMWIAGIRGYSTWDYQLRLFYNFGESRNGRVETIPLSSRSIGGLTSADLDGDGLPEVLLVESYSGVGPSRIHVFENDRGVLRSEQIVELSGNDSRDLVVGDIDQDGDHDLVVLNLETEFSSYYGWKVADSQLVVLLNDGAGSLAITQVVDLPFRSSGYNMPLPVDLVIGDLDGDGDRDLAVTAADFNRSAPVVFQAVEVSEGGSRFALHPPQLLDFSARGFAPMQLADLDTTGRLDVLLAARVLKNRGAFTFESQLAGYSLAPWATPATGDMSGDGQIDFAAATTSGVGLFQNDTPHYGPRLRHTPLKRGRSATFTVTRAEPGEQVHFLHTLHGAGHSVGIGQLGGITLDLVEPFQVIASVRADANGVASISTTIPPNAPLAEVVLQAVMRRGLGGANSVKTPFRTTRVVE